MVFKLTCHSRACKLPKRAQPQTAPPRRRSPSCPSNLLKTQKLVSLLLEKSDAGRAFGLLASSRLNPVFLPFEKSDAG